METVIALSDEQQFFSQIQSQLGQGSQIELLRYTDVVQFVEMFMGTRLALTIVDTDMVGESLCSLLHLMQSVCRNPRLLLLISEQHLTSSLQAYSCGSFLYILKPVCAERISSYIHASIYNSMRLS